MAQQQQALRLTQSQTNNIVSRALYEPDTYAFPLMIEGNSLFSSVWVKYMDPGASLIVRYFETTSGNLGEERVDIVSHQTIVTALLDPTYGYTNQLTVTPFHNKPVCEIQVVGGSVYFGVYVTVIETFASDLDAALKFDAQPTQLSNDKGIPIVGIDRSNNTFNMLEFSNGKLRVQAELVDSGSSATPLLFSNEVTSVPSSTLTTILTYTVPVGKRLNCYRIEASGNNIATYDALVGVTLKARRRTYFGSSLNTSFDFSYGSQSSLLLSSGETLTVKVTHERPFVGDFESFIIGSLVTI